MNSSFVHPTAVVEEGAQLAKTAKVWHFAHVRSGAILEDHVSIGKDVYVDSQIKVSQYSRVQNGVSLFNGLTIEPWCFIGPHVIFTNDQTPRAGLKSWKIVPTQLKTGMSIGAGAVIRCGVTIGEYSMVGAGAIVTKDVPPFHLVLGFPAVASKMVCACGQTFLALNTPVKELFRNCCQQNLESAAIESAQRTLTKLASPLT